MTVWTYLLTAIIALAAIFLYFIPTVIAVRNRNPNRVAIFAVNFLLGITILGYVGAILWATAPAPATEK